MEAWKKKAVSEGEAALSSLPDRVTRVDQLLASKFSYTSLKDVESRFKQLVVPSGEATENEEITALLSTIRDEVTQAVNALSKLEQWIRVKVPKIEDGNNFGVSVQREVLEEISDLSVSMKKSLNGLPLYFESRAAAWEKIATKASKETKTSTSATEETGGKDGDVSKTSNSSSTEEKTVQGWAAPDSSLRLVSIDIAWFVQLHHIALLARDAMIVAGDMIEKNMEKILKPKGDNNRDGGMYAY